MSKLPIEVQLDSFDEETPVTKRGSWKDRDWLTVEEDPFIPWLRLINPRVDAYASSLEWLQFLRLDEQDLEDLDF